VNDDQTRAAQDAVKGALDAIHWLHDSCHVRHEWAPIGWTPDETGLWNAHVGARNAAHHHSSETAGLVVLHSGGQRDDRLTWDIDPAAIARAGARSKYGREQASEYKGRLAGKPVLPGLRQIAALLRRSVA
jgi:hypothetical protein